MLMTVVKKLRFQLKTKRRHFLTQWRHSNAGIVSTPHQATINLNMSYFRVTQSFTKLQNPQFTYILAQTEDYWQYKVYQVNVYWIQGLH